MLGRGSRWLEVAVFVDASGCCSLLDMPSVCEARRVAERVLCVGVGVGPGVPFALFLVIVAVVLVSEWAGSVEDVGLRESRLRPLLP